MARPKLRAKELIRPENLDKLSEMASRGISERLIAFNYGISQDTFARYKRDYAVISEALKKGKDIYRENRIKIAEDELQQRIQGHYVTETTTDTFYDANGNVISRHQRDIKKWVEPSDTAIIFSLKKLKPEVYSDKAIASDSDEAVEIWHNEIAEAIRDSIDYDELSKLRAEREIDPLSASLYELERQAKEHMIEDKESGA